MNLKDSAPSLVSTRGSVLEQSPSSHRPKRACELAQGRNFSGRRERVRVWVQPLYQYLVIPNTLRGTNRGDGTNRADSESPFLVSELWP